MSDNDSEVIRVPATTEHLTEIRDFVRAKIGMLDFTEFEVNGIVLAVDEACANLILHAYHDDPTQVIEVHVGASDDVARVRIMDTAPPFDPSKVELPDMRQYLTERRHGGLGVLIMTRVMDEIVYEPCRGPSGANMLTLTKRRHP